jgi:hypothetical protein
MTDIAALSKESVNNLGRGAYLLNALPSAVLLLSLVALRDSRLLPWYPRYDENGKPIPTGLEPVYDAFRARGVVGAIVLVLAIVVLAVLLRPFQIGAIQLLEGYWRRGGLAKALSVERHNRNASAIQARLDAHPPDAPEQAGFAKVAKFARQQHRADVIKSRANQDAGRYPARAELILPTALGNVLRRAESSAGERYGLSTLDAYPRLFPHLSPRLETEIAEQYHAIYSMTTFVIVFMVQTVATTPLLWLTNWWSLLPLVLAGLTAFAYRGAVTAGRRYGVYLAAAFDLHRFDMLASMHLELHRDGESEFQLNEQLSELLKAAAPRKPDELRAWTYAHPEPPVVLQGLVRRFSRGAGGPGRRK